MGSLSKNKIIVSVSMPKETYEDLLKISRVTGKSSSSLVSEATGERLEDLKKDYPEYSLINVQEQIQKRIKSQGGGR